MMRNKAKVNDASIQAEEKKQAIAEAVKAMIDEPYDVTKARQAKETQEQAAAIWNKERPEGRYTIEEAIILLLARTGDYYRLGKAVESGEIPCYKHEAGDKNGDPKDLCSYVCWDDLNKWIDEKTNIKKFRFPEPDTAPDTVKNAKPIPVQRQQDDAILNWLKKNNYDPLKLPVPPSGKAGVKKLCSEAVIFSSPSVFKTAWDRLRANGEIRDAK